MTTHAGGQGPARAARSMALLASSFYNADHDMDAFSISDEGELIR